MVKMTRKKVRIILIISIIILFGISQFVNSKFFYSIQYKIHQDELATANVDFEQLVIGDSILKYKGKDSANTWSTGFSYDYGTNSIESFLFSERIWLNETHDNYYDIANYFYHDEVIKQAYTFPRPVHLIQVYEQMKDAYGIPSNDQDIMNHLIKCMVGMSNSSVSYATKPSEVPYIQLYKWDMPEYTVLLQQTDMKSKRNPDVLEVIIEIKPEALDAKVAAIKDYAIDHLEDLQFMEVDPFYEGFSRGKNAEHWVLLDANSGKITEYTDRDVYDYSYAKQGLVILSQRSKETYLEAEYQFVSTNGDIFIDRVTGYKREESGKSIQITALDLQDQGYMEKRYKLSIEGNEISFIEVDEFKENIVTIQNATTLNEQNAFLKDASAWEMKICNNLILYKASNSPDTTFYDLSGNEINEIKSYGGLYFNAFYKNPKDMWAQDQLALFVGRQMPELPIFSDTSIYDSQTAVELSESYIYLRKKDGTFIYGPDLKVNSYPSNIEIDFTKTCNTQAGPLLCVENTENGKQGVMTLSGERLMEWSPETIDRVISSNCILSLGRVKDMTGKVMVEVPVSAQWVGDHLFIFKVQGGYRVTDWEEEAVFKQYQVYN